MENNETKTINLIESTQKGNEKDENKPCLFREAINKFIDLLTSQMDSFPIIMNTLAVNVNKFKPL